MISFSKIYEREFFEKYKSGDQITVQMVALDLSISRPTAYKVIKQLLEKSLISPTFTFGERRRFYVVL